MQTQWHASDRVQHYPIGDEQGGLTACSPHECETRPRTNVSDAQRHTRRQSKSGLAPHATHARSAKRAPSWDTAGTYAFRRVGGLVTNFDLRCVAPNRWHSQRQSSEATQPTEPRPKQEPRPKHERVDVGALPDSEGGGISQADARTDDSHQCRTPPRRSTDAARCRLGVAPRNGGSAP